jgi:hypothetical protein
MEVIKSKVEAMSDDKRVNISNDAVADSHWGCMTCSAGTNKPVTNRQAEIAAANHASQGGHPTVYATTGPGTRGW